MGPDCEKNIKGDELCQPNSGSLTRLIQLTYNSEKCVKSLDFHFMVEEGFMLCIINIFNVALKIPSISLYQRTNLKGDRYGTD